MRNGKNGLVFGKTWLVWGRTCGIMLWQSTFHMSEKTRFDLEQADIPSAWYNLNADFPEPLPPPLHPGTKEPMPPEALEAIFPRNLIDQEISTEKWIEIPEPVRDIY